MSFGSASTLSGLSVEIIRHGADIELASPLRETNGYRAYREKEFHKLAFLGRARSPGFSVKDCRAPLAIFYDETRAVTNVKRIENEHLGQIEIKIAGLRAMHDTLSHLIDECAGDHRPDCPNLKDIGGFENFEDGPSMLEFFIHPGGCQSEQTLLNG